MTLDYLVSILKIILFDLVLSGDNAVVIGLAAHMLPPRQRRQAMIWGCGMAIAMRVALTLVVAHLLLFPGLRFIGALLLVWIACKLVQEEAESADEQQARTDDALQGGHPDRHGRLHHEPRQHRGHRGRQPVRPGPHHPRPVPVDLHAAAA